MYTKSWFRVHILYYMYTKMAFCVHILCYMYTKWGYSFPMEFSE